MSGARFNVDSSTTYNILPVCAGYGGLDLGLKVAIRNLRTVAYVEREAQACAGLAARMQDGTLDAAPIWSDLSTFDGRRFNGLVDCVVSSDPCQPNSVAGSRLGADDDRFLIDQLIRVIDEVRPSRVFRENVTGNADGQLAALIPALERMGYSVAAGIFSAAEVGASHRRERLFIMGDASSARLSQRRGSQVQQSRQIEKPKRSSGQMADAVCPELEGKRGKLYHSARRKVENGPTTLQSGTRLPYFAPGPSDPRWAEIIEEHPSLKPALCSVDARVANRVDELRAGGNGVCSMAGAIAWLSLSAHFE